MMKQLKSLIGLQIRDKIDLSYLKDKKQTLRMIIFNLLKFLIVVLVSFGLLFLSHLFILMGSDLIRVVVLIVTFLIILQLITCAFQLMKSLYFSEDNRVLITLPVKTNSLFISKLIITFIFELKKSFSLLVPFLFGVALYLGFIYPQHSSMLLILWILLLVLVLNALIVVISGLISIVLMYLHRIIKKVPLLEIIFFFAIIVLSIVGIVSLIKLIPTDIDLIRQWNLIVADVKKFLLQAESSISFFSTIVYIIIGQFNENTLKYDINSTSLLRLGILIIVFIVLFLANYFISRPLFFKMMARNFETNKSSDTNKPNHVRNKYLTFVNKEFIINLRTMNISLNYLIIYIAVPILVLFLNRMYEAMQTRDFGLKLIYAFNMFLITLPMLASNSLVATYYSREGRAGYIKKTKPILAIYPLFAKLVFNALFSIPSVFVTVFVFGKSVHLSVANSFILGLAILLFHYGHMIYSAMLDVMNPQNEQYATSDVIDNPNENKSTIMAFIFSTIFALISYKLFSEAILSSNMLLGCLKLLFISSLVLFSVLVLFTRRVKAFYQEI